MLNGCGIGGAYLISDPENYRHHSEAKLCTDYWASIYGNKGSAHTDARRTMIKERNLDCAPYEKEGKLIGERNDRFTEDLFNNSNSSSKNKRTNCTSTNVGGIIQVQCVEY